MQDTKALMDGVKPIRADVVAVLAKRVVEEMQRKVTELHPFIADTCRHDQLYAEAERLQWDGLTSGQRTCVAQLMATQVAEAKGKSPVRKIVFRTNHARLYPNWALDGEICVPIVPKAKKALEKVAEHEAAVAMLRKQRERLQFAMSAISEKPATVVQYLLTENMSGEAKQCLEKLTDLVVKGVEQCP